MTAMTMLGFLRQVLDDWKFVASVLDRLLLIIFLSVTIFGSMGILMQAPYILEFVDQDEIIQKLMRKYMKQVPGWRCVPSCNTNPLQISRVTYQIGKASSNVCCRTNCNILIFFILIHIFVIFYVLDLIIMIWT